MAVSLLSWWKMAGNTNDSSGNGNTATNQGASLTTDRFGNVNNAYSFNGSSSYMTVANAIPASANISSFSITAWVYPTSLNQSSSGGGVGGTILNADNDGNTDGYDLGIKNNNKIWWWPAGSEDLFSTGSINLNVWTHIALAANGSTFTMYINGAFDSTQSSAQTQVPTFLQIGSTCHVTGYWAGKLADIRIYSGTLTANNVIQIYQQFNQASNFFGAM